MKKRFNVAMACLLIMTTILITSGIFLILKSNNIWTKGIYFRDNYGYSSFIDEIPTIEIFYYNVGNDEDPSHSRSPVFITESNELLATTIISSSIISENKHFKEQKVVFQVDIQNTTVKIDRIRFYSGSNYSEFNIGNHTIQQITRDYELPRNLQFTYGNTIFDGYDLTIKNMSMQVINIEIVANNDIYDKQSIVFSLIENEQIMSTIAMSEENRVIGAIYILKPLVVFYDSESEQVYHNNVLITAIEKKNMTSDEVLSFINYKLGD